MTQYPELFASLAAPFSSEEVKIRSQAGKQLHYVTARTIMNRLDDVLGPENWWDDYTPGEHSVMCRLSIRLPDGTMLTKSDAGAYAGMADQGDDDKSGFADAIKRAAVKFGIGRELYGDGVARFVRDIVRGHDRVSNGPGRQEPSPERPKAAADQEQPFDPAKLPRAGSGAMYYWLKNLDKYFREKIFETVLEACKTADPPIVTNFKDWPESVLDDMVNRVIRYCKRLPNYRDEFGPKAPAKAAEPGGEDLVGARAACYAQAAILYSLHYPGKVRDEAELKELIKAYSGEKIADVFQTHDLDMVKATTSTILVAIADAKKTRTVA